MKHTKSARIDKKSCKRNTLQSDKQHTDKTMHNLLSWNILNSSHETVFNNLKTQYQYTTMYNTQVLKPTLHQNCPCSAFYPELWMASEKSHIISVQHFSVIKIIRKATIHKIIPSWHQVPPVHMVRPDDMQQVTTQGNHPHTFTAGCTPKLVQSLRQCQHHSKAWKLFLIW